ncbi:MAG: PAS domain S-box protein [Spirochaetia bacterium]|nr:PAS domain S-box protein [Spirochaetia bacterium]
MAPKIKLYLLSIALFAAFSCVKGKNAPVIENGVLDLSEWNFVVDGNIELKGSWQFFWKKLYTKSEDLSKEKYSYISTHQSWNENIHHGEKISGIGYGTYKLIIKLPENAPVLGIKMIDAASSYNLWFNNEKIFSNGVVSDKKESYKPGFLPAVVELRNTKNINELVVEVVNFDHYYGGLWRSPELGVLKNLQKQFQRNLLRDLFLIGALLIMGAYNIFMFYYYKKDKSPLYFSIFALILIFRALIVNERAIYQFFPDLNWRYVYKVEYWTVYLGTFFFLMYIYSIFKEYVNKRILNLLLWPFFAGSVVILVFPLYYYSQTLPAFHYLMILSCLFILYIIFRASRHKKDETRPLVAASIFLFISVINDILHNQKYINTLYVFHFGLFAFMLIQTGASVRRFGKTLLESTSELNAVRESFVETLEKQVQEKTRLLSESEAKYRALIELSPDSIMVVSGKKFVFINPAGAEILGVKSPDELIDKSVTEAFHPLLRKAILKQFERFSKLRKKISFADNRFILKNGKTIYLEMNIMRIRYNNKPSFLVMSRNNEHKLKQKAELDKLKQAVEYSPVSIVITDKKGSIEYTNPKFSEITGYEAKEALGKNPRILKSGKHDEHFYENIWNTLRAGNGWSGEIYNKKKNGDFFWERVNISGVKSGKFITHYVAVKEDISELKRIEKLKLDTELMMRHDMKNSLSGIIGLSELMLEDRDSSSKDREYLSLINDSATDLTAIISNYMAIFKMEQGTYKLNPSNFNLVSMFHEIEKEFAKKLNEKNLKLNIKQDYKIINGDNSLEINAEKIYLKILFSNLLDNAIQASPEKSEINISINYKAKFHEIQMHNAGVIPKEIQNRFFEKFATSGKKKGTGLGTYSARLIAKVHGGDISFTSSEKEGTKLFITLPVN